MTRSQRTNDQPRPQAEWQQTARGQESFLSSVNSAGAATIQPRRLLSSPVVPDGGGKADPIRVMTSSFGHQGGSKGDNGPEEDDASFQITDLLSVPMPGTRTGLSSVLDSLPFDKDGFGSPPGTVRPIQPSELQDVLSMANSISKMRSNNDTWKEGDELVIRDYRLRQEQVPVPS